MNCTGNWCKTYYLLLNLLRKLNVQLYDCAFAFIRILARIICTAVEVNLALKLRINKYD